MKVSYNWLKEFVDFDATPEQIADILTFQAFELEGMEKVVRHVEGVVVGKILEVAPHPNADKLKLTRVDIGGEVLDIVCGAPNCREGIIVPVAKPGVSMGEFTVESRKLRGEMSNGIILSEKEMNISGDHGGVLELDETLELGTEMSTLVPPEDTILDFEITVNRPDAMSHLGIAREIAAYFNLPLRLPPFEVDEVNTRASDWVKIDIEDPEIGPRYLAKVARNIKVGPSPLWMKARLWGLGQRPINNAVDVTNYVLLELGHPLHAFNYHLVKDGHIIVRLAKEGETFTTLDDQQRTLKASDLLIADPEKGVAVAGVMGGANSEVDESTKDVLIESAYFDPVSVRKTSKHLGLITEASKRFERGQDPAMAPISAKRCARLLHELAGAEILKGEVDAYPKQIEPWTVKLRPSRVNHLLGVKIAREDVVDSLQRLALTVTEADEDTLEVLIPTFRPDLTREVDLIEEVARIVGYNKVPDATQSRIVLDRPSSEVERLIEAATDTLVWLGYNQAVTNAMVQDTDQTAFHPSLHPFHISRALSKEMNSFRASLLPALLRTAEYNLNRGVDTLRLFEVGQVQVAKQVRGGWFSAKEGAQEHAAFVVIGPSRPASFDEKDPREYDIFDLKGDVTGLLSGICLDNLPELSYDTEVNLDLAISMIGDQGEVLLKAGQLKKETAAAFGIDKPVYVCEADLLGLLEYGRSDWIRRPGATGRYKAFSRYPTNERDLAFIAPRSLAAGVLEEKLSAEAGDLLESVTLFDLYEGKPLEKDQRSLAFRLVFRAEDRTLTDEDINPIIGRVVQAAENLDGVTLRT